MAQWIEIAENGLNLTIEITEEQDVRLLHFGSIPVRLWLRVGTIKKKTEVHISGENQNDHHGSKHTGSALVWQIKHNGSWHWEISDIRDLLYVQLSGPTEAEHQWWKELQPA